MRVHQSIAFLIVLCASCVGNPTPPLTPGDPRFAPSYGYHPIDPLPVLIPKKNPPAPDPTGPELLAMMPDETMRIAIGRVEGNGTISFGPAKTGVAGNTYVVILDYIKYQTQAFQAEVVPVGADTTVRVSRDKVSSNPLVPVYVGVGLRMTANVTVLKGEVDLGNLFALGVAAQANRVTGTMVVQTLGVSGTSVSTLIPMPSEINPTTIQNSILALGAIKAKLYDEGTLITPRVVGVYNTLGGGERTINSFIISLLRARLMLEPR